MFRLKEHFMKRFFTILFSLAALVLVCVFVSCNADSDPTSGNATQENDGTGSNSGDGSGTEANGRIILHAQYPYIYVWESGSQFDNEQSKMNEEGNGWYRFEIESSSAMVIFKPNADNWNGQTDDLHATAGEWWYKDGSLYAYKPNSGGEEDDKNYSVPSAPQNVKTEATSSSSIKVSWDAVEDADSYTVYYRLSLGAGNESYERDGTETVKPTTDSSVSIYDLTEWKIYIFFVTAQNSAGESFANVVFDYPCSTNDPDESGNSGTTTKLSAPTGLTATAASSSSVELSWDSVNGATTYYVYKSESSSSSTASVIGSTTSTSTTATGLKANTKYYFWVKAVNDTTISDYSSYGYATTKAVSSSSGGGSLTTTNDLLSDITTFNVFTAPVINKNKTVLTDGKNGFYIPLSNSSEMNAEYYILYRSTTSKTDKSTYKKIKTMSRSSNIAFEDFDIDFTKNKTYYYVVVATSSKNDTYGTISANALSIVLDKTRLYFHLTDKQTPAVTKKYTLDGKQYTLNFDRGTADYAKYVSIDPGIHTITGIKTNYDFLPLEYSINLTSRIMSTSPRLASSSKSVFNIQ